LRETSALEIIGTKLCRSISKLFSASKRGPKLAVVPENLLELGLEQRKCYDRSVKSIFLRICQNVEEFLKFISVAEGNFPLKLVLATPFLENQYTLFRVAGNNCEREVVKSKLEISSTKLSFFQVFNLISTAGISLDGLRVLHQKIP